MSWLALFKAGSAKIAIPFSGFANFGINLVDGRGARRATGHRETDCILGPQPLVVVGLDATVTNLDVDVVDVTSLGGFEGDALASVPSTFRFDLLELQLAICVQKPTRKPCTSLDGSVVRQPRRVGRCANTSTAHEVRGRRKHAQQILGMQVC